MVLLIIFSQVLDLLQDLHLDEATTQVMLSGGMVGDSKAEFLLPTKPAQAQADGLGSAWIKRTEAE